MKPYRLESVEIHRDWMTAVLAQIMATKRLSSLQALIAMCLNLLRLPEVFYPMRPFVRLAIKLPRGSALGMLRKQDLGLPPLQLFNDPVGIKCFVGNQSAEILVFDRCGDAHSGYGAGRPTARIQPDCCGCHSVPQICSLHRSASGLWHGFESPFCVLAADFSDRGSIMACCILSLWRLHRRCA